MLTYTFWLLFGQLALGLHSTPGKHVQQPMGAIHDTDDAAGFVAFSEFLDHVRRANHTDYDGTEVSSENDFRDMQAYIMYMYAGVAEPAEVTSFLQSQVYVDCIRIEEQPTYYHFGLKAIAEAPKYSLPPAPGKGDKPGNYSYGDSPLKQGLMDRFGNPISCQSGWIPMARLTFQRLTGVRTMGDFFVKVPNATRHNRFPARQSSWESRHLYAHAYQRVKNSGGNSWLGLWNPKADFSISQQWYAGGSGCDLQTIEGGWRVYPGPGRHEQAVLFIFYTNHAYNSPGCTPKAQFGCYNLDCPAFCQINNNWLLDGIWDQYSTSNNTQWGFEMQWKLFEDKWWLFLKGRGDYEAVGFYPTSVFDGGQLSVEAEIIDYGGEVGRRSGDDWGQMGSGQVAARGWEEAAFQSDIFWIHKDGNDGTGVWANLTEIETSPRCYTVDLENYPHGGDWGTYFYFGGSGSGTCS